MKLPFLNKKTSARKNYFGLFLKEDEGVGLAIGTDNGKMVILERERFSYSNGWDNLTEDVDEVIFKLERNLKVRLDDTILFIYSHFVDEKIRDIKRRYLAKIKEMVKNLELHALGYIECYEAVVNYLEKKEEMPLTAILVELDKSNLSIFIYKGGKSSYSKTLPRTGNLVDDLLKSFEELKGRFLLPLRLVLYNSKDLDDESTKILTYRWSEDYFVQIPRVEIIREEDVIEGLIRVFGEQIFVKVSPVDSFLTSEKNEVLGFTIGEDVAVSTRPMFEGLKNLFTSLKLPREIKLPTINLPRQVTITLGIFFIILALFLNEYFFHKAYLTVYLPAQSINQSLATTASLGGEKDDLRLTVATTSAALSDSKATTGKLYVGDKARGEATVHNFADSEKLFTKGTVITAGSWQFLLDDDVKVASSSLTTDGSAKLPGKSKVKIAAVAIGPESNLARGQRFKIEGLPDATYFAINENALTGGTKREARTISKTDTEDLKTSILAKAKSSPGNAKPQQKTIEELSKINLYDLKFSGEIGEEAASVSLQAKVDSTYYYYNENELINILEKNLKEDVKGGFKLEREKINYKINSIENNKDYIVLKLSIHANAIKDVAKKDILNKIVGKNKNNLQLILKSNFDTQGYEIKINEPVPFLNNRLPFIKKNISLTVSNLN